MLKLMIYIFLDPNPCRNHSCPPNASCYKDGPTGTSFTCNCDYGFKKMNNVCKGKI